MDTEIRVSKESWPWRRKFSCCSCRDSNPQPFNHKSGTLTTELSRSPVVPVSVTIWNKMRPRAPVQNEQKGELISTEKMSHKRHSNKDSCVCVPSFACQCQSDTQKVWKTTAEKNCMQYLSSGDLSFIVNPFHCTGGEVWHDEVEGLGQVSVNKTKWGMMTWPSICQQDKGMMKWKDLAWYLSTRQSKAWWLGLVSVNKTK